MKAGMESSDDSEEYDDFPCYYIGGGKSFRFKKRKKQTNKQRSH
jgi:hypothetical protein